MIHETIDEAKQSKGCPSQAGGDMAARQRKEDAAIKASLSRIKNKLFVLSGKGGVGKSSVSANLAAGLSKKGYKVGLMDVDVHGPSIAQMLGLKELLNISENNLLLPIVVNDNLKAVSVQSLMQDKDQAIIWRGPAKTGMIRQFVSSVEWGDLDYLIIDAPPGTGDEPLTVVQTIPDAQAIIVTTPQEVALADIRKSISFCRTVHLHTLGIIENMAGLTCPHCQEHIDLFSSGGGEKTAKAQGIPFLGSIPFDPQVVLSGDSGVPLLLQDKETVFTKAFDKIVENIKKPL
jgi:ATP-binding protein involved in chromosome partitioning